MSSTEKKSLSCVFLPDVRCSFVKNSKVGIMDRCSHCVHYFRFLREMREEDERVMAEIDEIRRTGVYK